MLGHWFQALFHHKLRFGDSLSLLLFVAQNLEGIERRDTCLLIHGEVLFFFLLDDVWCSELGLVVPFIRFASLLYNSLNLCIGHDRIFEHLFQLDVVFARVNPSKDTIRINMPFLVVSDVRDMVQIWSPSGNDLRIIFGHNSLIQIFSTLGVFLDYLCCQGVKLLVDSSVSLF